MASTRTEKRLVVLQPSYLPWLGYLDQVARADVFVFYDDVQFDRHGWRNRNRIRTPGEPGWSWLTIPVRLERDFPSILEVRIDPRMPWRRKHRRALELAYGRAGHLELLERYFGALFDGQEDRLAEVAMAGVRASAAAFGIETPVFRSSELGIGGDRNTRLLDLCRHFGATRYLSGAAARAYLDVELFTRNGIEVEWQEYAHPTYRQCFEPFVSHLSAVDALLSLGAEEARALFSGPAAVALPA
ncbi:MAG TPA: WbqC family protein [Candidatus Dormibacteraeota bacterium]|nr:WbqC family protein [Candidatus Dormibacteraeota bacterium]